jgi:hypothetical protein
MNVSTNHISYYVNGTSSPNSPRGFIYPGWMPIANFGAATFPVMANMDASQAAGTAIYEAMILWVKNARYLGWYPTNGSGADFTISTPWTQTVAGGSNVTCTITLNPLAGFTNTVILSATHLPAGVTASFNPVSIANGSGASTLTLSASRSVLGGIYGLSNGLSVVATCSSGTRTAPLALAVKSLPLITASACVGTNFLTGGTNGFPGAPFYVLGSTNVALPVSQWTRLVTNIFAMNGSFRATNAVSPATSAQFFRVQY